MRRSTSLLAVLAAGLALAALAADDKPPAKKSRRPKSTSRVITNEDVKKSKGKVIELPAAPEGAKQQPTATLSERHTALRIARSAAEERVRAGEAEVAAIENELARLERAYFEEDDPDVRDGVVARQFAAAREKATAAGLELAAARKALAELPEKP